MNALKALKVGVDGTVERIELSDDTSKQLAEMYAAIGCETVDFVRLGPVELIVDDEGRINGSPINLFASTVADVFRPRTDGTDWLLHGIVLIVGTTTPEGDTGSLDDSWASHLTLALAMVRAAQ